MSKLNNLQGKRFGKWSVLEEIPTDLYENTKWKVRCDCGTEKIISGRSLIYLGSTHCGCERTKKLTKHKLTKGILGNKNFKDETGNVYGRLTAIKPVYQNAKKEWYWECICSCGLKTTVRGSHLRNGSISSCGCLLQECRESLKLTHGMTYTKEYVRTRNRKRERLMSTLDTEWTVEMEVLLRELFSACVICGITEEEHQKQFNQSLHIDHVLPLNNGNGLTPANATILCHTCNSTKWKKSLTDLSLEWQAKIISAAFKFKDEWDRYISEDTYLPEHEFKTLYKGAF